VATGFSLPQRPDLAQTANGVDPKAGLYKGKTKQGKVVRFRVKNGKVKRPRFTLENASCTITITSTAADEISASGRFRIEGYNFVFKGRFVTNRKVKGRATIVDQSTNPFVPSCGTLTSRYTARRQ
jgi:hypothetical protein